MTMIARFIEAVDRGLTTFTLANQHRGVFHFISNVIDGARFFYCAHSYDENDAIFFNPESKYELAVIVANRDFYFFDTYTFDRYNGKNESDYEINRVCWFDDYVSQLHGYYKTTALKSYLDSIEATKTEDSAVIEEAKEKARNCILDGKPFSLTCDVKLTGTDAIAIMVGYASIVDVCRSYFEKDKEHWEYVKSLKVLVEDYMFNNRSTVVEDWEMRMAEALTSIDAKTVTIVGENNGLVAESKMETEKILRNLKNKDAFSALEFPTEKTGRDFIKAIGLSDSGWRSGFNCGMIQRILFRKKAVYER